MKAVKRYFKENIGILAALLVMIAFLCIYPRTASTFPGIIPSPPAAPPRSPSF